MTSLLITLFFYELLIGGKYQELAVQMCVENFNIFGIFKQPFFTFIAEYMLEKLINGMEVK